MRSVDDIAGRIAALRGTRVILDADLAKLYGVETRHLLQAMRRNARRFPPDFVFQLENHEIAALTSQSVISKVQGRGGRRRAPFAFTEHGVVMAATVLHSPRAIEVSVFIVRAFVEMRNALSARREISRRLDVLEQKVGAHDGAIQQILQAIRRLMDEPARASRKIGFVRD